MLIQFPGQGFEACIKSSEAERRPTDYFSLTKISFSIMFHSLVYKKACVCLSEDFHSCKVFLRLIKKLYLKDVSHLSTKLSLQDI